MWTILPKINTVSERFVGVLAKEMIVR